MTEEELSFDSADELLFGAFDQHNGNPHNDECNSGPVLLSCAGRNVKEEGKFVASGKAVGKEAIQVDTDACKPSDDIQKKKVDDDKKEDDDMALDASAHSFLGDIDTVSGQTAAEECGEEEAEEKAENRKQTRVMAKKLLGAIGLCLYSIFCYMCGFRDCRSLHGWRTSEDVAAQLPHLEGISRDLARLHETMANNSKLHRDVIVEARSELLQTVADATRTQQEGLAPTPTLPAVLQSGCEMIDSTSRSIYQKLALVLPKAPVNNVVGPIVNGNNGQCLVHMRHTGRTAEFNSCVSGHKYQQFWYDSTTKRIRLGSERGTVCLHLDPHRLVAHSDICGWGKSFQWYPDKEGRIKNMEGNLCLHARSTLYGKLRVAACSNHTNPNQMFTVPPKFWD